MSVEEIIEELLKLVREERRIYDKIEEWQGKAQVNQIQQRELVDKLEERL